jgi:hypothetical protein
MLEATELALEGGAATVQSSEAGRLTQSADRKRALSRSSGVFVGY